MEKEIKLPVISESEETGLISEVYIKEGDQVEAEQSIVAVESDKATVDVPVEEGGVVKSVNVKEGDEIRVGDVIIVLETNGEKKEQDEGREPALAKEARAPERKEEKQAGEKQEEAGTGEEQPPEREAPRAAGEDGPSADSGVPAAPLARRFARELGLDIHELANGYGDRITREDVFDYARKIIEGRKARPADTHREEKRGIPLPDFSQWGDTERRPMSGVMRETAAHTVLSWQNMPHVTHFDSATLTRLETFRKDRNEKSEEKITVTAILLKVIGEALKKFPKFNASLDLAEKEVVYKKYYHVGVAVDTPRGLLLPVIRDVNKKTVPELAGELSTLAEKARNGKLSPEEMKGGNFVISNLGGIGGTAFTPVIFPPQAAILGVSRARVEPVYRGKELVPETMLPLSLSYDHRLVDGADAARFLRWVCEALEEPFSLVF